MSTMPFETTHRIVLADARNLEPVDDASVDLVVTSPPYPMIRMWDGVFCGMCPEIEWALEEHHGSRAFELMHRELDKVWKELFRVMKPGRIVCVNIGDATRTVGGAFRRYPNHARITTSMAEAGFDCLPLILWRKQTNAPNKFMGSGMLPAGAYVTLEHEYILVFRKPGRRDHEAGGERNLRMQSAFFWEERNRWFSDVWDFKGVPQSFAHKEFHRRSAAFPLELPCRLISMYSLYGDTVLDPFAGTGTTLRAGIACGRHTIGVDINRGLVDFVEEHFEEFPADANTVLARRIEDHGSFVQRYTSEKGPLKYLNAPHGFPVVTKQETGLQLRCVNETERRGGGRIRVSYDTLGRIESDEDLRRTCSRLRALNQEQTVLDL